MRTCAAFFDRYWSRLKNMSRRQKYTSLFVFLAILIGVFLVPAVSSADTAESISGAIIITLTQFFLWLASLGIQLAIFFLKFFILLAGYNGFINADIVKFGWSIVRDVANMFFIVILLIIAFGTILGLEQYEWKKSLPKLVFAAIFVNFSNVICQLIIDVSQVFTITFLNAVAGTAGGNLISIMKFDDVFTLMKTPPGAGTDVQGDLVIGALFAMFFCFVAAAAVGSYMIVMLYRVVTLWCLIILSPLAFLFSILPSTKSYADEFWKEFINHVIAAPMMVFFLWLAFSTFGGGDIVQDNIQAYNVLEGYKLDTDSDAVGAQTSVTISRATSWLNLGNFAVAIGFLTMGIERVQKLGVRGGDYIQRGLDFAKNVFTIFAGVKLAQAGARNTGQLAKSATGGLAKGVLNKFPGIGGDAMRRYGRSISGYTKKQYSRFNIVRDDAAVKSGDWLKTKMPKILGGAITGAIIGGTWTKAIQSNARAEKVADTWQVAADSAHKRWDEEVSTSKTAAGKAKLTEGVKLDIALELAGVKKELKFAQERSRLTKQIDTGKVDEDGNRIMKDSKFGAMYQTIANTEVEAARAVHHNEKLAAEDKDVAIQDILKQAPRYEAAFYDHEQKELEEKSAGLNYREATRESALYARKLAEIRQPDGTIEDKNKGDARLLGKNVAASLAANMKKGRDQGMTALDVAARAAGWTDEDEETVSTPEGMQRKIMTAHVGRKFATADEGFEELTQIHGEKGANAILKQLDGSLKVAAVQGALNVAGLFNDRNVDPDTNRIAYSLEKDVARTDPATGETVNGVFENIRTLFGQMASGNIHTLQTIQDMVGRGPGNTFKIDDRSIAQLSTALGSLTPQTRVNSGLIDSLKKAREQDQDGFRRFLRKFTETNKNAAEALKIKIGDIVPDSPPRPDDGIDDFPRDDGSD